jgi:hypothetical protein
MRSSCLTIALSLAAAASAAAPPQGVEITYEVARNGSVMADVELHLAHDGRTYRISETTTGRGIYALRGEVTRSSQGAVAADGLRPQKFEEKSPGREARQAGFDPAARTPTLQRQDRLSLIWTLAFAPPREAVTMSVADGRNVRSYTYQVAGRERVKTPAGEFDALKLVRHKAKPNDRGVEIWLAADRHYLPVRTLVTAKDGSRVDQVAAKITVR